MSKRIYVGNLPWNVTKAKLEELFSGFGEIEDAIVLANKYTGRSRGFGFVTYKNESDAKKAIEEMNEKEVEGRNLVVKEARPLKRTETTSASPSISQTSEKVDEKKDVESSEGQKALETSRENKPSEDDAEEKDE